MSLSGGMMAGYIISKGDAFWTYSLRAVRHHRGLGRQ